MTDEYKFQIHLEEIIMKNIAHILEIIVQLTLMIVLLFNRQIYSHCVDLDG